VEKRTLNVKLTDEELKNRKPSQKMIDALAKPDRGWQKLYVDHVTQADTGADLDFLVGSSGSQVLRESH
jgi:dihydroxy-acid dehydratase